MRADLVSAFMLLTRLPVRGRPTDPAARAAWAWPVAGLAVGGIGAAAMAAALALGVAPGPAAALAVAAQVVVTGALHEDGLADVADGFWGGRDRVRRLAIMRDSRIGTYGAVALVLSLLARWSLLAGTSPWALVAAGVASRAAMVPVMQALPHARSDGLSHAAGRPTAWGTGVALALAALALGPFGLPGLAAAGLAAGTAWGLARLARAKIGGQTGDVCGAVQQGAEIAVLAALASGYPGP